MSIAFGPVPSRRLGRSLGVNNIPRKWCSYACVYCQIGDTIHLRGMRREFYDTDFILESVREKLQQSKSQNESIDYLAFVPDGEPTLDSNLGKHIAALKTLDVPVAVITNASLIPRPDVQKDLYQADLISFKVDSVNEPAWRKINRPYGMLGLDEILSGMLDFRNKYTGKLITETMLIKGMNDSEFEVKKIRNFLGQLKPDISYISIPTRPPADRSIEPASSESVNRAWQIFSDRIKPVELLTGYEGNAFSSGGDLRRDILSITAVHPLRQDALEDLLLRSGENWSLIDRMIEDGELIKSCYKDHLFYLRKF